MKGHSSGSWQDFCQQGGGKARSSAWSHLLKTHSKVLPGRSQSSAPSSPCSVFADPAGRSNFGQSDNSPLFKTWSNDLAGPHANEGLQHHTEHHRRAALDFVLELAGPRTEILSGDKVLFPDAFVSSDEIPVPLFAVDRDMCCTLWNQRISDLSMWSGGEIMAMEKFPNSVFAAKETGSSQKSCEDLLKACLYGRELSGMEFLLKQKNGKKQVVSLSASLRTDAVGAVSGVLCVVIPKETVVLPQESCGQLKDDVEDDFRGDKIGESCSDSSVDITPTDHMIRNASDLSWRGDDSPTSSSLSLAFDGKDFIQRTTSGESTRGSSSSSSGLVRSLVVDALSATRSQLASQLERCGMDTVCASSAREAVWRFEQSLTDPDEGPPFSVVFVDLQAASNDSYSAVREIRLLEKELKPQLETLISDVIVVAITSMNRWDLAGMDNCMDKGMSAGVDAVIPQNIKMQQLRTTLRKFGVRSKYLDVPTTLPRALSGLWHNPLNLSR